MSEVKLPIFMDNHSTTRVDPRVLETMLPYFDVHYGNAASRNHVFGWAAEAAVENARNQVASLIGGDGKEIVWTSGATESNNLAIKGAASFHKKQGNHIITVETEHKSVIDTCKRLQREGYEVTYLTPQKDGIVTPEMVTAAMTDKTIVVSIMLANNEIGVVQDINALGAAIKAKNPKTLFHIDAVQRAGGARPRQEGDRDHRGSRDKRDNARIRVGVVSWRRLHRLYLRVRVGRRAEADGQGVLGTRRLDRRRSEEPRVPRGHDPRLRARHDGSRLQVQQSERQGFVWLWRERPVLTTPSGCSACQRSSISIQR